MTDETSPRARYRYHATVVRVIDGDTLDLLVNLAQRLDHGFRIFSWTAPAEAKVRFRLKDIDAPERGAPGGAEATAWLSDQLRPGFPVVIDTDKDPKGGFGRWAATVWFPGQVDVQSVNQAMIEAGHAKGSPQP